MDHSAALIAENERFGQVVRDADWSAPVPTCPGWTIKQLFRHLGRGHRWAAQIIGDRVTDYLDPREVRDGRPPDDVEGAIEWLQDGARLLLDVVRKEGPDATAWTFVGPRPAAWWVRRRLHEATVHRADAALAVGAPYELEAPLAADGVDEWLDLVAARGNGGAALLDDGVSLHLHATDEGLGPAGEWMIRGAGGGVTWEHGHGKGAAAVRGPAVELLLALLRRRTDAEAGVEVLGDRAVWTGWLERTPY